MMKFRSIIRIFYLITIRVWRIKCDFNLCSIKSKWFQDIEDEELHKHFCKCGDIDYVRTIRDNKTGIGKGFGYVKFKSADSISLAIKLNGSFIREQKIRVQRCVKKTASYIRLINYY
jgi:RNA recognition motif-containing protein